MVNKAAELRLKPNPLTKSIILITMPYCLLTKKYFQKHKLNSSSRSHESTGANGGEEVGYISERENQLHEGPVVERSLLFSRKGQFGLIIMIESQG